MTISAELTGWRGKPDPALWLLLTERETGLRTVGRMMSVRLGSAVAYLWHLSGAMSGAAPGRPHEAMISVQSSEACCPLADGLLKIIMVAPPELAQQGQEAFATVASSWRWANSA
jgi:hypothetical protein